jgi:MYXO-CTERM domain-containing protein
MVTGTGGTIVPTGGAGTGVPAGSAGTGVPSGTGGVGVPTGGVGPGAAGQGGGKNPGEITGGCSCETARGGTPPAWAAMLGLAFFAARRKRRLPRRGPPGTPDHRLL